MSRKTDIIDLTKLKPNLDNSPLVSVIVPSYNVEEYIDQCLTSILNNCYQNIELLVIDDRSTDGTVDHIKALMKRDKRIRLFHNPEDHNIYGGACRNIGLDNAKGKYVYFCDSDDYILPGLIPECVRKMEKLNAEICCFRHKKEDVAFETCEDDKWCLHTDFIKTPGKEILGIDDINNYFQFCYPEVWDKFFSHDFIRKHGLKFEELQNSNDVLFYVKSMLNYPKITYIDRSFYVYRTNVKTSVQRKLKAGIGIDNYIVALEHSCQASREHGDKRMAEQFELWLQNQLKWFFRKNHNISTSTKIYDILEIIKRYGFYSENIRQLFDVAIDSLTTLNKYPWDRFDKIVCIHYLPYKDRLENIKSELKRVGILDLPQFEWYYTVDNELYEYVLGGIPDNMVNRNRVTANNIKYTVDSYSLLKKLQYSGYKRVLVIEDDIVFLNDLNMVYAIVNSTPDDFDVMNYDADIVPYDMNDMDYNMERVCANVFRYRSKESKFKMFNMSCVALSRNAIDRIIAKQQKLLQPFDVYSWQESDGMNVYFSETNVCVQKKYNDCQSNNIQGCKRFYKFNPDDYNLQIQSAKGLNILYFDFVPWHEEVCYGIASYLMELGSNLTVMLNDHYRERGVETMLPGCKEIKFLQPGKILKYVLENHNKYDCVIWGTMGGRESLSKFWDKDDVGSGINDHLIKIGNLLGISHHYATCPMYIKEAIGCNRTLTLLDTGMNVCRHVPLVGYGKNFCPNIGRNFSKKIMFASRGSPSSIGKTNEFIQFMNRNPDLSGSMTQQKCASLPPIPSNITVKEYVKFNDLLEMADECCFIYMPIECPKNGIVEHASGSFQMSMALGLVPIFHGSGEPFGFPDDCCVTFNTPEELDMKMSKMDSLEYGRLKENLLKHVDNTRNFSIRFLEQSLLKAKEENT